MRDELSRVTLSICVVLLLAAMSAAAASEGKPEALQPRVDQSAIWGWWPVVPWDDRPVAVSGWAEALNRPLDITRKGKAGDQHCYQVKRVNVTLDRHGRAISRMVAEAELSRTLVREAEPGLWVEQCEWQSFATGMGTGPKDYPTPQELPGARGISFEFSPDTFDYINPPADFARVGDEMAGYLLKILTMDAMGWDGILHSLRECSGGKVRIGETSRRIEWEPWDITSVTEERSVGRYHAGELQTSIAGLTRFRGEPCVLIWLSMEGNEVTQKMDTPQFAMDLQGTEYFRGEIAASLVDGRVVAMEISGPVPCVMKMGFGSQPLSERPIGAIIQQVSMWETSAGEGAGAE